MTTQEKASRREMLQGALGTGVIASSGAVGGIFARADAASQTAIGPNTINRQWLLVSYAESEISAANFKYQEVPLGDTTLDPGDILVRNIVYAPSPGMRVWMHAELGLGDDFLPPMQLGKVVRGIAGVARVVKSENPKYPVGALMMAGGSWEDYTHMRAAQLSQPALPAGIDPVDAISLYVPGPRTAYFGMLRVGEIKAGETVVVSAAAGSVGSTAVQIAKIKGCRVIGIAGGKDKCDRLIKDYGIDAAIDYKNENVRDRVHALAPKGVEVYFDNVGGTIMQDVVDQMAKFGRVVLCGAVSSYNEKNPAPGPRNMVRLFVHSVTMRGFLMGDFNSNSDVALAELREWKDSRQILLKTDVRTGFKKLAESFVAIFSGGNEGTLLVKTDEIA